MDKLKENKEFFLTEATQEKWDKLISFLSADTGWAVAFSGGADSTLLLLAALFSQKKMAAFTIVTPLFSDKDKKDAQEIAQILYSDHFVFEENILQVPQVRCNAVRRCYYCKKYFFEKLKMYAAEKDFSHVIEGSNIDDESQYRPGKLALKELGIISPLQDLKFNKKEIRLILRHYNIPNWAKPASPCLATRFPYGTQLQTANLSQVAEAEAYITSLGFLDCRLRWLSDGVMLEVPLSQIKRAMDSFAKIVAELEKMGFSNIRLNPQGITSGYFDNLK